MKPAGGNYQPLRRNVGRVPQHSAQQPAAAGAAQGAGQAATAQRAGQGGYKTARVLSASPMELILIMYEQFFELLPDIRRNIQRKAPAAVEPDAERAQAIIEELINALDFTYDISKDLGAIYFYVRDRILDANVRFKAELWDEIEALLRPLYEGFKEAARQQDAGAQPTGELDWTAAGVAGAARDLRGKRGAAMPSIIAGITYGQGNLREVVVNTKNGLKI